MKENDFLFLLLGASFATFKFTEKMLMRKDLIPEFRYNLFLNMSYDKGDKMFIVYPEDNNKIIEGLTDVEVVKWLCREEKIPVWIDIFVDKIEQDSTIFKLVCAGRYSNNESDFYYKNRGSGPFGIKFQE